jgi:predicted nuclease with TOPRIM domain
MDGEAKLTMESTQVVYRSPKHKLVNFFEKSRNNWKQKHSELKAKAKYLANRVSYLEKSKQAWKEKAELLQERIRKLEKRGTEPDKKKSPRRK